MQEAGVGAGVGGTVVGVGPDVAVGVIAVGVIVGESVAVGTGIGVAVAVGLGVAVGVGTDVGVGVDGTGLIVGVGSGWAQASTKTNPNNGNMKVERGNAIMVSLTDSLLRIPRPPIHRASLYRLARIIAGLPPEHGGDGVSDYPKLIPSRDSPDQTDFPGYSSRGDTGKYNPVLQGRQMRPDSLKVPAFIGQPLCCQA